jgi:uncharacterized repeat protein (TIGR04076 family)
MAKVKITVLKRMFNQDLADEYCQPNTALCDVFSDGQEFVVESFNQPDGFCAWAWNDIQKELMGLLKGGGFAPWMKADNNIIACCTDGIRPVVFNLERLEG